MTGSFRKGLILLSGFLFFITGLLFIRFETHETYVIVSISLIFLLALPSYIALVKWLGLLRGLLILIVFSLIPLIVEIFAIYSGFPYGIFSYSPTLGPKVLNLVPWTMPFAYLPILLGALSLSCSYAGTKNSTRILAATALIVLSDLVIDPAAVRAGFWIWDQTGHYYGIPVSNFIGWGCTGLLYSFIFWNVVDHLRPDHSCPPRMMSVSLFLIVCLGTGFSIHESLIIPVIIGGGIALACAYQILDLTLNFAG